MKCADFELNWDAWQEGLLAPSESAAMREHLEGCEHCRTYAAQVRDLRRQLAALPDPPMRPDFPAQALRRARRQGRWRRWTAVSALAAGVLAAAILVGVRWGLSMQPSSRVLLVPQQGERTVTLALDSRHSLQDVTFEVRLPANVELAGYPGQRDLRWKGHLQQGRNGLSLPLKASGAGTGTLVARIEHQGQVKEIRIRLRVSGENQPSASSESTQGVQL
ncbi:MAG TPA: zf-HC2 domain-containing protein [Gammaproteobacteria bacterium]|nr:zf-HC2 domain-containing protein [Gammaproteobacteria bacterium]